MYAVASRLVAARAAGRRAVVSAVQHLSLSRASRGRHQSRILPRQAGRAALDDRARSDQAARRLADRQKLAATPELERIQAEVNAEMEAAVEFAIAAPYPADRIRWTRTFMPDTATQTEVRELTFGGGRPRSAGRRNAPRPARLHPGRRRGRSGHAVQGALRAGGGVRQDNA